MTWIHNEVRDDHRAGRKADPGGLSQFRRSPSLSRLIALGAIVAGAGCLLMAGASYYRYSVVGFDRERLRNQIIIHAYHRLRWPGDGTLRWGMGVIHYTPEEEDLEAVDLAGRLFEEPERGSHRPATLGFGLWSGPEAYDTEDGIHVRARWISVPAWLPGIVLLAIGLMLHRRRPPDRGSRLAHRGGPKTSF